MRFAIIILSILILNGCIARTKTVLFNESGNEITACYKALPGAPEEYTCFDIKNGGSTKFKSTEQYMKIITKSCMEIFETINTTTPQNPQPVGYFDAENNSISFVYKNHQIFILKPKEKTESASVNTQPQGFPLPPTSSTCQ